MESEVPFEAIYLVTCPKYLKTRVPQVLYQLKALGFDSLPLHTVISPDSELALREVKAHARPVEYDYAVLCTNAHVYAYNDMVCRGYGRALILECDARLMNSREKFLKRLSSLPDDCDVAILDFIATRNTKAVREAHEKSPSSEWLPNMTTVGSAAAYVVDVKAATLLLQKHNEVIGPYGFNQFIVVDWLFNPPWTDEFNLKTLFAIPVLARQCTVAATGHAWRYKDQFSNCARFSEDDYKWPFT